MLFSVSFFIIIDKTTTDKSNYNTYNPNYTNYNNTYPDYDNTSINYNPNYTNNTVIRVIDGDTFEIANHDIIRLICVDAPEKGDKGYEEAKEFLESLILFKEVQLEKSIDDKDKYQRLLRFVYVNYTIGDKISDNTNTTNNDTNTTNNKIDNILINVNKEIIQNDYGSVFPYGNNTNCDEFLK